MKKVLSLLVALSMLLAVAAPVAIAVGETGYADVDGTTYEGPVSVLRNLGIMAGYEDGAFHPYDTVTRAEMAAIGVHMRGIFDYSDIVSMDELQYNDMAGHWAAGVVAYARAMGIIDGSPDGNFYPNDPITYEQVIKIVVSALGYDYYAEINEGYPNGYINIANDLKLTKGVGFTVGSYATRGDVAKIVYNALTADIMEASGYSGTEVSYKVVKGKNILNTYFDVAQYRGVVEANDRTGIYGVPTAKKGQVKIGDEVFLEGNTGIASYLGYYVTLYALEDSSSDYRTIISFNVESNKNDYIILDADVIRNVSLSSSRYVFEYESGTKTKTVRTSTSPLLIYNGVAIIDYTVSDLAPISGQVTLLDNDRDGEYDIIDVLSYDIMLVSGVSEVTGNVTASYSTGIRSIKLDTEDDDYTVRIIDKNGNSLPFSSIKQNSVLSAAISRDKDQSVRTVIVSNDSVTGEISGISQDGFYIINGKAYEAVSYVRQSIGLSPGDSGTFYLTHTGVIAGFSGDIKVGKNMGMYIAAYDGGVIDGGVQIKLLRTDGTTALYPLAARVTLNGESYTANQIYAMIADEDNPLFGISADSTNPNLHADKLIADPGKSGILYRINAANKITEIVTATATYGTPEAADAELSVIARKTPEGNSNNDSNNYYYSTQYHCFHKSDVKTYVTDSTVLFMSDDKASKTDDSQIYWVRNASSCYNNENFNYFLCYFFYVNNKEYADFAVFYDPYDDDITTSTSSTEWNRGMTSYCMYDRVRIVDRIVETYDPEYHEKNYRLVYWENGASQNVDFNENADHLAVANPSADNAIDEPLWKRGDLVWFVRTNGQITDIGSLITPDGWNTQTDIEKAGGKELNKRYMFPAGAWEFRAGSGWPYYNNNLYQRYKIGRISKMRQLMYFSTFDLDYGTGVLTDEPLSATVYRLVYDNRGYLTDIENVGIGAVAEDQLVLTRQNGSAGQIAFRVTELFILYDYSEFTDEQKRFYAGLYSNATTAAVGEEEVDVLEDKSQAYIEEI